MSTIEYAPATMLFSGTISATVGTLPSELTIAEASELLCVSEPFLVDLLDSGAIAYRKIGNQFRVQLDDAVRYKKKRSQLRKKSLDELVQMSQEMGLYD